MFDYTLREVIDLFDLNTTIIFTVTLASFIIPTLIIFPPVPIRISEALSQTHSKLGVPPEESKLPKPGKVSAEEAAAQTSGIPKILSLMIYPVKSCKGIELSKSKVVSTGLQHDRIYVLARLKGTPAGTPEKDEDGTQEGKDGGPVWEMVSQRQFSLLAKVSVDVWCPDPVKTRGKLTEVGSDESFIIVRFPWSRPGFRGVLDWAAAKLGKGLHGVPEKEILLPMDCPTEAEIRGRGYSYGNVKIWKDTVMALNMEKELPRELGEFLGVKDRLGIFRMMPGTAREVYRCAPKVEEAGYQPIIKFQDAYAIHLLNITSVRDVDKNIGDPTLNGLDIRRFRGNIIIAGPPPYEEETWKSIQLNQGTASVTSDCTYHVSCRTARCKLPNNDPETGIPHRVQPDKYLRANRNVDEGSPLLGSLGMMLTPVFPQNEGVVGRESCLEVGMEIDVKQRGQHRYIMQ